MKENFTTQVIDSLEKQLNQRLEKLWRIFSWTSSILVAITGGVIVLSRDKDYELMTSDLILISIVVVVLTLYAIFWIDENLKFERKIRDQLDEIFNSKLEYPGYSRLRPDKARFGYNLVVLLLGSTALIATWANCFFS